MCMRGEILHSKPLTITVSGLSMLMQKFCVLCKIFSAGRDRTADPGLMSPMLYQLSYRAGSTRFARSPRAVEPS